jgi:cytochrome b
VRFAGIVLVVAGIWGIVVLTPFYWLFDVSGRRHDPPTTYPHFFYGFFAVALAWRIAFLVIGSNPARFRALMVPACSKSLAMWRRSECCWGRDALLC